MATYIYKDHDDSSGEAFFAIVILTIFAAIIYFFLAFIAVGVTFGTFTSISNYIKAVRLHPDKIGRSIAFAWNANVEKMEYFFDIAQSHKDSRLIKLFMAMSGMGVVTVGTVLLPVWSSLHCVFWTLTLPFHKKRQDESVNELCAQKHKYMLPEKTREIEQTFNIQHQKIKK